MKFFYCFLFIFILGCDSKKNPISLKQEFDNLLDTTIAQLSKDDFFGLNNIENVIPIKDSIIYEDRSKIKCYYSRYLANLDFYDNKTALVIDAYITKELDATKSLYIHDENLSDHKLEPKYISFLIKNVLYKIELENDFANASTYLLNIKIKFLESYISLYPSNKKYLDISH